jgi:two-component system, NtrC family, response regulator AtoC
VMTSPGNTQLNRTRKPSIFVVEPNRGLLEYVRRTFANQYRLSLHLEGGSGFNELKTERKPDLFLVACDDNEASEESLRKLRALSPATPLVALCCHPNAADYETFATLGVDSVVLKPFAQSDLQRVFDRFLPPPEENDIEAPEVHLDQGHSFIRSSKRMRQLEAQATMVARSDIPVLILGESGTGKEILALFTHKMSLRSNRMFMKINCAAMPAELLESELFGYEQGAFTGAMKMKPGKFEICDKGTIFLDEIGEMPAGLQAKLLQVLQDGTFSRLGGRVPMRTDVRIIAATNVDMKKAMAEKAFREDLYYRLNGISLKLPPLRERQDEIPVFAKYFMQKGAKKYGLDSLPISSRLLAALMEHSWPGNLREMENVINRYLVLQDEKPIIAELLDSIKVSSTLSNQSSSSLAADQGDLKKLVRNLKGEAERVAIMSALDDKGWNRKAAAGQLQISYKALLYKIKEYSLSPNSTWTETV